MNDFLSVEQIESSLEALNRAYPSLTRVIRLPNETEGPQHRRSNALLIRGNPNFECRPALIFISGVHANEWGGPDILVNLAADLLEAYTTNAVLEYGNASFSTDVIRSIVDRTDIIVFPDVNPEGYAYSRAAPEETDQACWRKNRAPFPISDPHDFDPSKRGVDINRNYDFLWDFPSKFSPNTDPPPASTNPRDGTFHGHGPFSEAESRNVQWLVDNSPNARYFVDIHSFHGYIMYPWGDDQSQTTKSSMSFRNKWWDGLRGSKPFVDCRDDLPDESYREYMPEARLAELRAAATAIHDGIERVRGENYETGDGFCLLYPVSGSSKDWAFSREFVNPALGKLNSFVIEFNKDWDFFPEWDEMLNLIADIDSGLIALCEHARPGPFVIFGCWFKRFLRVTAETFGRFLKG